MRGTLEPLRGMICKAVRPSSCAA